LNVITFTTRRQNRNVRVALSEKPRGGRAASTISI